MSIASAQQSFLANALIQNYKPKAIHLNTFRSTVSCKQYSTDDEHNDSSSFALLVISNFSSRVEFPWAKLAVVTLAAGVLTLGSVHDASAAKSGGRIGGQAFRSSAPRYSSPRTNNSRTNIYVNPRVAPPLVGGYGYGYGYGYGGGWGWSPFSFFAPGPGVAVGVGGGFDTFALFLFIGAAAAVIRRFTGRRDQDDDDDY